MKQTSAEPKTGYPLSDLKEKFGEIIRYVTLSRMKLYAEGEDYKIVELHKAVPHGYVFANSMSMIIVAGRALKIVLKTHFNQKDAKPIVSRLYGLDEVDDRQTFDVMKEYCNLSAGFLKKICIEQDVPVGISLPVVTLGFNEVFADLDGEEQKIIFEDCWKLTYKNGDIICSCQVDVFEPEVLARLMDVVIADTDEEDDEYEFL